MIGILDWELCTLGSPLADLGNLLLPFSLAPVSQEEADTLMGRKAKAEAAAQIKPREEAKGKAKAHAASVFTPPSDMGQKVEAEHQAKEAQSQAGKGDEKEGKVKVKKARQDMTLLVGLHGLSSDQTGLPDVKEIEGWWVRDMNAGVKWHAQRQARDAGDKEKAGGKVVQWQAPISGMGYVLFPPVFWLRQLPAT